MRKNHLLPFALFVLSHGVFAQQPPSAGSQIQQIPSAPLPPKAEPAIRIAPLSASVQPAPDETRITVQQLQVTGARVYTQAELLALTGFQPGSELSLNELNAMAMAITERYRHAGYFLAQAYLPAQEIRDAVVTIAVIEGEYGEVSVRNQSPMADSVLQSQLAGLHRGDIVEIAPLESRLLLLSDLPGVKVASTLVPGATPGTSDLIVDVEPGQRVTGSIDADNAGNRYTGAYRLGATVNLNNPAGRGDVASLRLLTSGEGLNYARGSYQMQFGKATAGVAYSWLEYELGKEFRATGATGSARIASLYGSYPLIRSRNTNLYAGLALEHKTFQDKNPSDLSLPVADKKAQVLTASLRGDHRDSLGGGGVTGYSLAWSAGNVDRETAALSTRYGSQTSGGHFNKLSFGASRLQGVTPTVSLYAGIHGQVAFDNLDVSEKMELGGMYGVRGFPPGEAYADQGYVLTLEARVLLPTAAVLPGQVQLIGFVDTGSVELHRHPGTTADNRRTLSAAGVGLNWSHTPDFLIRASYARPLGNEVATSAPDKSGRFWIQAVKYF
ncbi:MAG: ShlB/FhaC/HecB family hemolysin secretion/activation protein [Comamonas sp.]